MRSRKPHDVFCIIKIGYRYTRAPYYRVRKMRTNGAVLKTYNASHMPEPGTTFDYCLNSY